jgi:hypothetical protein
VVAVNEVVAVNAEPTTVLISLAELPPPLVLPKVPAAADKGKIQRPHKAAKITNSFLPICPYPNYSIFSPIQL